VLILSGKEVAAKVLAEVKASVAELREQTGGHPTLAVILVGEDPASQIYVRNKKRAADEVGITTRDYLFPQGCSQAELLATIAGINRDPAVHGILLQLPLPKGMDEDAAVAAIAPEKDADGLHPMNLGNLLGGKPGAIPCTPAGCVEILDHYGVPIEGAEAVVMAAPAWSASRSRSSCSRATPPSPCATRARGTWPRTAGAPTSSASRPGRRAWSPATWCARAWW
jgi:methylenetetrahydrofolate dehydrogenase (NADP+)/methenyltetrahydrofolate cyclohydrolase